MIVSLSELVASGWSPIPARPCAKPDEAPSMGQDLSEAAAETRAFADELDVVLGRDPNDPVVVLDPDQIEPGLVRYLLEGGRRRRFLLLDLMYRESVGLGLDSLDDPSMGELIATFRDRMREVVLLKSHSETVVIESLVVGRQIVIDRIARYPSTDELSAFGTTPALPDSAVEHEPLYALLDYIARIQLEYSVDPAPVRTKLDVAARCMGAVRNEARGIANVMDALFALVNYVQDQEMTVAGAPSL